jgi:hypothetical protein
MVDLSRLAAIAGQIGGAPAVAAPVPQRLAPIPAPDLLKTFVQGHTNKDGTFVEGHYDSRPVARKRPAEAGASPIAGGGDGGARKAAPPAAMPKAKHYAAPSYRVGSEVRVKGRAGVYEVVATKGRAVTLQGADGARFTIRVQGTPMAKAEPATAAPRLLLKAQGAPHRQGDKGQKGAAQGAQEAGKQKGKGREEGDGKGPQAAAAKKPGAGAKPGASKDSPAARPTSGAITQHPPAPMRGAPEGEGRMKHHERVRFQHGEVIGEGEIVASGADGVMVKDDAGREHPVRHTNLLGPAHEHDPAMAPGQPGEGLTEGSPADQQQQQDAAIMAGDVSVDPMTGMPVVAGEEGDMTSAGAPGEGDGAADMGEGEEGEDADPTTDMDPSRLKQIMAALKNLAPLFGQGAAKKGAKTSGDNRKAAAAAKKGAPK